MELISHGKKDAIVIWSSQDLSYHKVLRSVGGRETFRRAASRRSKISGTIPGASRFLCHEQPPAPGHDTTRQR